MPRDYKVYLEDIIDAARKIRRYVSGRASKKRLKDERTFDAVVRNLEIIGEAVKNIPDKVRSAHPEVEWKKMTGLRDILAHQYFSIDDEIILDIIENKLPVLESHIEAILRKQ